jgi:hypothetical protein
MDGPYEHHTGTLKGHTEHFIFQQEEPYGPYGTPYGPYGEKVQNIQNLILRRIL